MSLFITFEGGEGCGKSYQSRALYRELLQRFIPAILIHEPGGTALGEKVRQILKHACDIPLSPLTELMLFNASRSQLVSDIIQPALTEGKIVICDRFSDSTLAYQSGGRGLDIETVKEINRIASQGLKPDITFLLDAPVEIGLARKKAGANDRFEQEAFAFHRRVREVFLKLADTEKNRWVVIDGTLPRRAITGLIWQKIRGFFEKR